MTAKALATLAARFGAIIRYDENGRYPFAAAEAPHRKVWTASHLHELCEQSYGMPRARQNLADRMIHGLTDCTDTPCDWCDGL